MVKVKKRVFSIFFLMGLLLVSENTIAQAGSFVHYVKANPWSTFQSFLEAESQGSNSAYVTLKNQTGAYGYFQMEGPMAKGSNYSLDFKHSSFSGPILGIFNSGNIGVGPAFTGSTVPSSLLHLKSNGAALFLDGTTVSGGATSRITFGYDGVSDFEISHPKYNGPAPMYFRIGPVLSTNRAIFMHPSNAAANKIIFSSSFQFCTGDLGPSYGGIKPGLSGSYIFDDQVSSPSLLVAPPISTLPYTTIPAGYLFSVRGNANMNGRVQVNNSTSTIPDNSVQGLNISTTSTYAWVQTETLKPLALNPIPDGNPSNSSYVAIGFIPGTYTVPLHYKLAVKGKIICEELKVKYAGVWSDYVFAKEYKLRGLKEVEQFITENKHLPDVPSEAEIKENGFEAGQMDATLLRKIEELTLYMIEQNKKIEEQNKKMEEQSEKMEDANERLKRVELENIELRKQIVR